MLRSLATVFVLGMLSLSQVIASDREYLTIAKMRVEPLIEETVTEDLSHNEEYLDKGGEFAEVLGIVDGVIALGKKIWPIVEAGRPVVGNSTDRVNVVPFINGAEVSTFDLEGWRAPKVLGWRVVYENLYGMDVVAFTYKVRFQYGGSYDGKGAYIANATVETSDISVAWGYTFSGTAKMNGLANAGTRANPIAALTLTTDYQIKTVLKEDRLTRSFYLTGTGQFQNL